MFEVQAETDFAAAHFLKDYHGKCENLHGHNYRVRATVRGDQLDEGGMLVDFGELKKALRSVCSAIDHTNLNDMAIFKQNPSAERIAKYIFDEIKKLLPAVRLYSVDVYETPINKARYFVE